MTAEQDRPLVGSDNNNQIKIRPRTSPSIEKKVKVSSTDHDKKMKNNESPRMSITNNNYNHNHSCSSQPTKSRPKPTKPTTTIAQPPDGGWGWVIVFCSFMIHVIADGVTYTFGIFYVELVRYYAQGKGLTAWVPSIMTGVTYGIGPIASGLTNKYGCRSITIIGTLFASLGLLTSVFATSVVTLFFTIGICAG